MKRMQLGLAIGLLGGFGASQVFANGPCCLPDGSCLVVRHIEDCTALGGTVGEGGLTCEQWDCGGPKCGNGRLDTGEQCDDGNTDNTDGCRNDCTLAFCGDGIVDAGEACDDGNTENVDGCRNDCTLPFCGDGITDSNEQCDDGNTVDTDACRNNCTLPACGDGSLDAGEQCDGAADDACPGECGSDCKCPLPIGGCRITGGRTGPNGGQDAEDFGDILLGQGGGQVGAPCGCIGCFTDPDPNGPQAFEHIQGNWQYNRKDKTGSFHAKQFNSLICGCDATSPTCDGSGVVGAGFNDPANFATGQLCNHDNPIPGPEPRHSPANIACFSGLGAWSNTNGPKPQVVAFRVEIEDRGEPSVGGNADDTCDVHRIRIWIPTETESATSLADGACCTNAAPVGQAARAPDIDDGGNLTHGNLQIHPLTPNSNKGRCPVPAGSCQE